MADHASSESDPPADQVVFDLPCDDCGYNLKTIDLQSVCPECGETVIETVRAVMEQGRARFERTVLPGDLFRAYAELTGLEFDTLAMVWSAIIYFREIGVDRYQLKLEEKPIGARTLCYAIRDVARVIYGLNPHGHLEALHLATAEQVRDVILILVSHKLLDTAEHDRWSDFEADDCPDPAGG